MPAAEVTERWSDEKCSIDWDTKNWTAQRGWDVAFVRSEAEAIAASSEWAIGEEHARLPGFFVKNISPSSVGPRLWRMTAQYTIDHVQFDTTSPLMQPEKIKWTVGSSSDAIDQDNAGNPLTNSALIPVDGLQEEFTTLFLTVTKNFPFFDVARALTYSNRVNSKPVTIRGVGVLDKGQLLCRTVMPTTEYTQGTVLIPVAHEFEIRAGAKKDKDGYWDGFKRRFMDVGRRSFYNAAQPATSIVDGSQQFAVKPQQVGEDIRLDGFGAPFGAGFFVLDANGKPVAPVGLGKPPPGATLDNPGKGGNAVFLKYMTKHTADLNGLLL